MAKVRNPQTRPVWQEVLGNVRGGMGLTGNPFNPVNGLEDVFMERGHPKVAQGIDTVQQLIAMLLGGPGA